MYNFDVRRLENIDDYLNFLNFLKDSSIPYPDRGKRSFHYLVQICHKDHSTGSDENMRKVLEMSKMTMVETTKKLLIEFIKDLRKNLSVKVEGIKKATESILSKYIALPARHVVGLLTGKTRKEKEREIVILFNTEEIANTILNFVYRISNLIPTTDTINNAFASIVQRMNHPANKSDRGPPFSRTNSK